MGLGDKLHDTAEKVQLRLSNLTNVGSSDPEQDHKVKSNDDSYEDYKHFTSNEVERENERGHPKKASLAKDVDNVDKMGGHALGRQTISGTDKGLGSKVLNKKQPDTPDRKDMRKDVPPEAFMKGETTAGNTYGLNSKGQYVSGLDDLALAGGDPAMNMNYYHHSANANIVDNDDPLNFQPRSTLATDNTKSDKNEIKKSHPMESERIAH
ncbi:hypothetical protein DFJ63DRAFT_312331 [Scheffersomyces coipomensis]|uniref:uncharacterized protein n=1 Tax=Scheffersomyces coipomensis TaxID=1788519 RepID=UPI00315DBAB2